MKQLFSTNKKWNNAIYFATLNGGFSLIGMSVSSFYVKDFPLWLSIIVSIFLCAIAGFLLAELVSQPSKLQINSSSLIFYFAFDRVKEYKLDKLRYYAMSDFGGRAGHYHAVVLEFNDGSRMQIPSIKIEKYREFLHFLRNSDVEYFGYIGSNNWRRKNKPLSKKWVIPSYEKELEEKIGKENYFIIYFLGVCLMLMNLALLYAFLFPINS